MGQYRKFNNTVPNFGIITILRQPASRRPIAVTGCRIEGGRFFEAARGIRTDGGDMKVLLVEDNALMRYTIKSLLNKLGHEVVGEAQDVVSALKSFSELKPDVVLLDIVLPGKSGVELLEELRKICPGVRVAVITAVEQDEIDRRLADKGVAAILRKPFSFDDFKALMKDLA